MKNILIFDTYPISIKGLQLLLEEQKDQFHVMEASSIDVFVEIIECQHIDIVFFGVNQVLNLDFLKRKYFLQAAWIVYFSEFGYYSASQLIDYGAMNCIGKDCKSDQILKCINEVAAGRNYVCERSYDILRSYRVRARQTRVTGTLLSSRESEIASLLSLGMRTSEIALKLSISLSTVSTIKFNIFRKMQVVNIIQLNSLMN